MNDMQQTAIGVAALVVGAFSVMIGLGECTSGCTPAQQHVIAATGPYVVEAEKVGCMVAEMLDSRDARAIAIACEVAEEVAQKAIDAAKAAADGGAP